MTYNAIIKTPIGKIGIITENDHLCAIEYLDKTTRTKKPNTPTAIEAERQIKAYFDNPAFKFTIPCKPKGTDFQSRVWKALLKIDTGKTRTYGEVAKILKSSPRAVGNACRRNPISIIIPCHRVLAKTGIGGYSGDWETGRVSIKEHLLRHEKAVISC